MRTDLLNKRTELIKRAHSLKTKPAQRKAWSKVREIEDQLEELCRESMAQHEGRRFTGRVMYSGTEVLVETQFGTMQANACNDVQSKSWYASTCCVSFERDQTIEFTLKHVEYSWRGFSAMLADIVGGKFDAEEYSRLSSKPGLAFFKYPTGMSGLFAQGAVS